MKSKQESGMTLAVNAELTRRLRKGALRRGLTAQEYACLLLEGATTAATVAAAEADAPADLVALATAQGAPLAARFEDLLGDFWPEDESADEFDATIRQWRREGSSSRE